MSNKVVFSNAELYEKVFPGNLASLIIEGYWDNPQYTDEPVDTTGLNFKAVYDNRCIQVISPVISPASWSDVPGEQTATFSYTEDGTTVTATKTATVEQKATPPTPTGRKSVGGIIFYIDSTADGTYTFYNANGTQVSAPTVGTDCTGWTYEVTGASKDKFYVVYNELYTSKQWGGYGTSIGASGTAIGTGRSNTTTAIGSVADVSGSIWETIRNMRTNALGGCDDWFVGSQYELDALRTSGAGNSVTWFSGNYIWASSEASANRAWYWRRNYSNWGNYIKYYAYCVCGVRAF